MLENIRISKGVAGTGLVLIFICLVIAPACALVVPDVVLLESKNISINLSDDYQLQGNISSVGMVMETFSLNSTMDPSGKNASITILSMFSTENDSQQFEPGALSRFLAVVMIGALELSGGKQVGSVQVQNSLGENVTVTSFEMPAIKGETPAVSHLAFWNIDPLNVVILSSELDLNTTLQIVQSMEVLP